MKFCVLILGFITFVGGCAAKKDSDPYPTVSDFCHAWSKDACSSVVVNHCSGMDTTPALTEACVEKQQAFCEGLAAPLTGYSSAQADACLGAVSKAYADATLTATEVLTVRHLGAPCNHLNKGPKGAGDMCTEDTECDTLKNFQCVMKSGVGTCALPIPVANGTSCTAASAACMSGFYCDGDNCVQSKPVDGKCSADYECASGLSCAGVGDAGAATGKCATRVSPSACTQDSECTSGVCDIAIGASTGMCVTQIILAPTEGFCGDLR